MPRRIRALETVALVGIGGFAGSNLRYVFGQVWPALPATIAVNTLGSFLLGLVIYVSLRTDHLSTETRLLVSTGFLSSFTTYSTFALLAAQRRPTWIVLTVLGTYGLGFAGVIVGRAVAVRIEAGENR
ncbi:MAG: CrcB family protein [Halodesulfurarchaeum sp.]